MEKPTREDVYAAQQEYRRARLVALIAAAPYSGNLSALGRAMGYKDGVFIRQMRDHERAISEKTVAKIEVLHPGWFADDPAEVEPISETDWSMLEAFKAMSTEDREAMLADAMARAERFRRLAEEAIGRYTATPEAAAADAFKPKAPPPARPFKYVKKVPAAKHPSAKKRTA